jgi:hypothetical protein
MPRAIDPDRAAERRIGDHFHMGWRRSDRDLTSATDTGERHERERYQ